MSLHIKDYGSLSLWICLSDGFESQYFSFQKLSTDLSCLVLFRYIDNGRVMHDIISKESYGTQYEAIQHCFRIIGFSDEVSEDIFSQLGERMLSPVFKITFGEAKLIQVDSLFQNA